ncbi:MAG: hypothetical protein KDB27_00580 [Planctomycetales bacterium]|nr:hypothetical protein [Planctomycetales bacterium]
MASRSSAQPNLELVLFLMINGGALYAFGVVAHTCIRRSVWTQTHSGHWFAAVYAWSHVESVAFPSYKALLPFYNLSCIAFLGMATIYIVAIFVTRLEWYWKLTLLLHAVDSLTAAAWRLLQELGWQDVSNLTRSYVQPIAGGAAVLVIVVSIGADFWGKRFRDWLHWIGITWILLQWYVFTRVYLVPHFFPK